MIKEELEKKLFRILDKYGGLYDKTGRNGRGEEELLDFIQYFLSQTLQRFIGETIGKMYRNAVLSDKYPDLAKESKIKFETKQEIEEKMKQWLKENL